MARRRPRAVIPAARILVEACPELGGRPCYVVTHRRTRYIVGAFDTVAAHVHRAQAERIAAALDPDVWTPRPPRRRRPA
jgi:hypothetical protein